MRAYGAVFKYCSCPGLRYASSAPCCQAPSLRVGNRATSLPRSHPCKAEQLVVLQSPIDHQPSGPNLLKPDAVCTARTILDIAQHGTISTMSESGLPLGTYVTYTLDTDGQPILRLRADAVHTSNLLRNPRCSLFVQPPDLPARRLARATLIGQVVQVDENTAARAAEWHADAHAQSPGVDSPQPTDLFYKLQVQECFFVGGMGSNAAAELLTAQDYLAGAPDELRHEAPALVASFNTDRLDDVLRIGSYAAGCPLENMYIAELLWVDTLGVYVRVAGNSRQDSVARVQFHRPVTDARDARSMLTLLAQVAWERDRKYVPASPTQLEVAA